MRKLKYRVSRQALNQMHISYIRPTLEYLSIAWDGCSEQDKATLEKLQNEAARIVTGLTDLPLLLICIKSADGTSLQIEEIFKNYVLCTNVPTILFQTISLT